MWQYETTGKNSSAVQVGVQPVFTGRFRGVDWRGGHLSWVMAITGYCYSELAINNCFFGGAKGGGLFSCPPRTGSSRYPLISLRLLVLLIAIVTRPL